MSKSSTQVIVFTVAHCMAVSSDLSLMHFISIAELDVPAVSRSMSLDLNLVS
ncbi:hypothetical protein N9N71_00645 [Synechococcus sp. AH-229-G18]|nr:hypothetical protein [Synechococcus sp. AH-229-G18]